MLGVAIAIRQVDCNAAFTFLHLNNTERSRMPVASNTASETAHDRRQPSGSDEANPRTQRAQDHHGTPEAFCDAISLIASIGCRQAQLAHLERGSLMNIRFIYTHLARGWLTTSPQPSS